MSKFFFKLIAVLFSGMYLLYFIFFAERLVDLKKDPAIKEWMGREFELKRGVFLYQYRDSEGCSLGIPGEHCGLPKSIDDYFRQTNEEKSRYSIQQDGSGQVPSHKLWRCPYRWLSPLMPRTRLRIQYIYRREKPAVGWYLVIESTIENGPYKSYKVNAVDLFRYEDCWDYKIIGPKEEVMTALE